MNFVINSYHILSLFIDQEATWYETIFLALFCIFFTVIFWRNRDVEERLYLYVVVMIILGIIGIFSGHLATPIRMYLGVIVIFGCVPIFRIYIEMQGDIEMPDLGKYFIYLFIIISCLASTILSLAYQTPILLVSSLIGIICGLVLNIFIKDKISTL